MLFIGNRKFSSTEWKRLLYTSDKFSKNMYIVDKALLYCSVCTYVASLSIYNTFFPVRIFKLICHMRGEKSAGPFSLPVVNVLYMLKLAT